MLFLMAGCTAHIKQIPIEKAQTGKSYWLKKSLYGGIFYDDDRYRLLSERPFEELKHLKSLSGDLILPPPSDEVIPVGTQVYVQKIEWPTQLNWIKRPILTPRHLGWVYLTVALDRGSVTLMRDKPYVLLIPEEIQDDKTLQSWLSACFSEQDNNLWFLNLKPAEREAILKPPK